jgi:hypothetical protein
MPLRGYRIQNKMLMFFEIVAEDFVKDYIKAGWKSLNRILRNLDFGINDNVSLRTK